METQTTTNYEAQIKALRNDLLVAWGTRNLKMDGSEETCWMQKTKNAQTFFNSIDPENMVVLNFLFKHYGYGSLLSYAIAIKDGKVNI